MCRLPVLATRTPATTAIAISVVDVLWFFAMLVILWLRSYLVNVSANYKNTFKHLFPYTSLSSDVVNKL
ncbi:MAG: hypothetical protein WCC17_11975, partial [Candidatus Nitrosopolaris sp.]